MTARISRRQLGLMLLAGVALGLGVLALVGAAALLDPESGVAPYLLLAVVPLVAALLAAAVPGLRREAERVLTIALVLMALAVVVLLAVGLGVLMLGRLPRGSQRDLAGPLLLAVAATALVAGPVAMRAAALTRRGLQGRRRTPQEVVSAFGNLRPEERGSELAPGEDELLRQLAEALSRSLAASAVEIWTGDGGRLVRAMALPERQLQPSTLVADAVEVLAGAGVAGSGWLQMWLPELLAGRSTEIRLVPVSQAGTLLGLLVAERAATDPRFTEPDERLLADVAQRLAVVLHNRRLDVALQATLADLRSTNEQLRASRARIVAASDAERRRIERDLHDGAQQHLVALAVNLGLARKLVSDDPQGAAELLDETSVALRETVQQVRDLAHGIYPPLLMDAGLGEALRSAASRSPQPVQVVADGLHRYPAEIEAAVYFCCLEALQNAAKHAPGAGVRVVVSEEAAILRFEVTDNGPGFDVARLSAGGRVGQGLQNMADRMGAIGGQVEWDAGERGGARVRGAVPVPAASVSTTGTGAGATA